MNGIKGMLQSKTVWALIIAGLAKLAQTRGWILSAEDQGTLVDDILQLIQYGGLVAGMIFRVTATKLVVPFKAVPK